MIGVLGTQNNLRVKNVQHSEQKRTVTPSYKQHFFLELPSHRRLHYTNYWYSLVQTLLLNTMYENQSEKVMVLTCCQEWKQQNVKNNTIAIIIFQGQVFTFGGGMYIQV